MTDTPKSPLALLAGLLSGHVSPLALSSAQWPPLVELAQGQGVAAVLLWRLAGHDALLPPDAHAALKRDARAIQARALVLDAAVHQIHGALHDAGIPAIWLKGAALARTIYPDPTLRPMIDLDVLVEADEPALTVLKTLGYTHHTPPITDAYHLYESEVLAAEREIGHHHVLTGGLMDSVQVELHYQLLVSDDFLDADHMTWFWQQTVACDAADQPPLLLFRPEAHLLYLCVHALLHEIKSDFRLIRYLDLHWLILHAPLDWAVVVTQAERFGWIGAVEQSLRRTHTLFGTPVPDAVWIALRDQRPGGETLRRFYAFYEKRTVLETTLLELRGLAPPDRLRLVGTLLLPPRAFMRRRYPLAAHVPVALMYPYRWLVMLAKLVVNLVQMLYRRVTFRRRHTDPSRGL